MNDHLYLICDKKNTIARICGIVMFGIKVDIPAIFCQEEEALSVLFELEEADLLGGIPHAVRKIDQSFTSTIG